MPARQGKVVSDYEVGEPLISIFRTIAWLVPMLLGAVLGALLFYTIEVWGVGLQTVVVALAGLTAGVLVAAFGTWLCYRFLVERLKERHGEQFSSLVADVASNVDLLADPEFRNSRLWPVMPTVFRIGMGWISASFSLTLGITLIANLTLMATLAVQYLQVDRLSAQNRLLETQNQLSESTRRAALVQELSDILNEIDEELDEFDRVRDSTVLPRLTPRLEGRINALSRSLRPYQFLEEGGFLTETPISPERGQLVVSLLESGIDLSNIWRIGNFLYSDLNDAELADKDMSGAILFGSRFRRANLKNAILAGAQLHQVDFTDANLAGTDFRQAQLFSTDFSGALLPEARLFDGANLISARFVGARVPDNTWIERLLETSAVHEMNAEDWRYAIAPKVYRGGDPGKWVLLPVEQ